jgi:YD repeat-containing protein
VTYSYGYDGNGNLTHQTGNGTTTNFSYDVRNRMTIWVSTTGGLSNYANFKYDGWNNRLSMTY